MVGHRFLCNQYLSFVIPVHAFDEGDEGDEGGLGKNRKAYR